MHELSLLTDLLIIFAAAVLVVLLLSPLGLPSIAGMIIAGVMIGPNALALVHGGGRVEALAEVGVVLLLFSVGLELPFHRLKQLWRPIFVSGALQVLLTSACTLAVALWLDMPFVPALVLALAMAPSSTAIVLRQLDTRGEVDAPHGRQMLGILLFQDLCVVPMMLVLSALTSPTHGGAGAVALSLLRSAGVLLAVAVAARIVAPFALELVARTKKRDVFVLGLLVLGLGTAWAATLAGVALSLGAFLAGVVIASSPYRHQAMADLIPFREVFTSLFFVSAGMLLDASLLFAAPWAVLGLLACIVVGKALVILVLGAVLRMPLRVSVLAALGLSQVGEFGLVLLTLVRERNALPPRFEAELLAAAILSMIATPLLLGVAPKVAKWVERLPLLPKIYRNRESLAQSLREGLEGHVIIAGYGVAGRALAHRLHSEQMTVLVVDLNGRSVRDAAGDGFTALYGDISNEDVLDLVGAKRAAELVLLINDAQALERAVVAARRVAAELVITVRSRYQGEVAHLLTLGATHVVAAEVEAGRTITEHVLSRSLPPNARTR